MTDIKLVEEFFKVIKETQNLMHDHIFLTIKRMLEMSRSYPEKLVTALRIIEREEVLDEEWNRKKKRQAEDFSQKIVLKIGATCARAPSSKIKYTA